MSAPPPGPNGSWAAVNWNEFLLTVMTTAAIGVIRALYLIRKGRKFRWLDFILEPSLAVLAGMVVWALLSATNTPDVVRTAVTSLGAWGGPKTIQWLELRYFGGLRLPDTMPGTLGEPEGPRHG